MNENKKKMSPNEYLEEFAQTLSKLYDENRAECLFKEWPIDIKYYGRKSKNKPIYTQEAEFFLKNYSIKPREYFDSITAIS